MTSQLHCITTPFFLKFTHNLPVLTVNISPNIHSVIHHLLYIYIYIYIHCYMFRHGTIIRDSLRLTKLGAIFLQVLPLPFFIFASATRSAVFIRFHFWFIYLVYTDCPKSHFSEILRYKECDCWQQHSVLVLATVGNTVDTLALQFNSAALKPKPHFLNFVQCLIFFKKYDVSTAFQSKKLLTWCTLD